MNYQVLHGAVKIGRLLVSKPRLSIVRLRTLRFGDYTPRAAIEPLFHAGELMGWKLPDGTFMPRVAGASRDHDIVTLNARAPAATATTVTTYTPLPNHDSVLAFLAEGFTWIYETTEANADNTLDWDQTYGAAGTGTTLFTNVNPNGLLDTGAPSTGFTNRRNAAASGAAAAAASDPADVRVAVNQVIQTAITSAGTGTIPALQVNTYGKWI